MPRRDLPMTGLREMFRNVRQLERTIVSVAETEARRRAEIVAAEIRELAPVESGDLRDSIEVDDVIDNDAFADESVIVAMYYAPWVEFGTRYFEGREFVRQAAENLGIPTIEGIARKIGTTIDLFGGE